MLEKEIRAYALRNAIEHGEARADSILPKLFQHGLEKKDIKKVIGDINKIVGEVNSLSYEKKLEEYAKFEKYAKEREEKEGGLPELENAEKEKVVTRLAPEPSKYNHIGHALVFIIQYLYAKKYGGRCILRFDDSDPEKSTTEFYNAMKEDLSWLGIKWDKELLASNDIPNLYKLAEKLIMNKDAFVCSCPQEDMKKNRMEMKECECRKNALAKNLEEWKKMLNGDYKEGERTLRLKGDMKSNNGVMRDPVIARISFAEHFIQGKKYSVWPMYDFENPIEDSLNGVTHVIRTNEFELRAELHKMILKKLGLGGPIVREIGRYQITGAETQGRKIREMIQKKQVIGWDDPRLVTVKALRRRGFVPEMFLELAQTVGLSKAGGHIDPAVLAATNRKIIDPIANRYSFVDNPIKLEIKNAPKMNEVEIAIHPDKKEKRKIKLGKEIYISNADFRELKGKEVRLIHLYNIELGAERGEAKFTSMENKDVQKINWVSIPVKARIMMDNAKWREGIADEGIKNLKVGDIIQFERFGFCKLDNINKEGKEEIYEFWFAHK